jgi:hypothetical protein
VYNLRNESGHINHQRGLHLDDKVDMPAVDSYND